MMAAFLSLPTFHIFMYLLMSKWTTFFQCSLGFSLPTTRSKNSLMGGERAVFGSATVRCGQFEEKQFVSVFFPLIQHSEGGIKTGAAYGGRMCVCKWAAWYRILITVWWYSSPTGNGRLGWSCGVLPKLFRFPLWRVQQSAIWPHRK